MMKNSQVLYGAEQPMVNIYSVKCSPPVMYIHYIVPKNFSFYCKMKIKYYSAYKSVKFVRAEMLEGMGPSREHPSMCL